ncbi:MAG: hypothetical protein JXX28_00135 [Deltaproteobacteria bacterium]|nr:hypothetical protein [Deltaproteobacteria bacterium]
MVALLLLLSLSAHADETQVRRVASWVQAGKVDKAADFCERLAAKGIEGEQEREVCASATLERLLSDPEPRLQDLDQHWAEWANTGAARRSREMAAERRLQGAVRSLDHLDVEVLNTLATSWMDTPAGAGALEVIWRQALDAGTSQALQAFIQRYPDAPQVPVARTAVLDRAMAEAKAEGTVEGWERFLATYPDHPQVHIAAEWIATFRFREAEAADTVEGWEQFLATYPRHRRADEAQRALVTARFREAETPQEVLALVATHPDFPRAALLRNQALVELIEVRVMSGGQEVLLGDAGPAALQGEAEAISVRWPEGEVPVSVSLAIQVGDRLLQVVDGLSAVPGWTRKQAVQRAQVSWNPVAGVGTDGLPEQPLCQPTEGEWVLVLRVGAQERVLRFVPGTLCG